MSRYFFTRQASQDLTEIYNFVVKVDIKAAARLLDLLEDKCRALAESPKIGRARNELALALRSFPAGRYVIYYRPVTSGVQIIRILHGSRDIESIFRE